MEKTPISERVHIGIFGVRNAGKSSLINAITGQDLAVVSDMKGTTTDPVIKTMELTPLGPVVIIDTPGFDDTGELGRARVNQAVKILRKCDIILLVSDAVKSITKAQDLILADEPLTADFLNNADIAKKPCILVKNKADLLYEIPHVKENEIYVSAKTGYNINELKKMIAAKIYKKEKLIVCDILPVNSTVILVIPIDKGAPKGRLILPQQQILRELLDFGNTSVVCRDTELKSTLEKLKGDINLVITDSQVFKSVGNIVPASIKLISFSILFARYKCGSGWKVNLDGVKALDNIKDNPKILICEGCTHHRQCDDIGTVKLPGMIRKYTGTEPLFYFTSGGDFPDDIREYSLILHCGGCMLNENEMRYRYGIAKSFNIPITNYGIAMAFMNGILERSIEIFRTCRHNESAE